MKQEQVNLSGSIEIVHKRNGEIIETRNIRNTIVTVGKAEMAGLLVNTGSSVAFDNIAIGTGTTGVTAGDTTLETESMRETGVASRVTTAVTNDTAQLVSTFAITSTLAITESGMFNDATTGEMLNRTTFSAINLVNGDSLEYTWKIQFS